MGHALIYIYISKNPTLYRRVMESPLIIEYELDTVDLRTPQMANANNNSLNHYNVHDNSLQWYIAYNGTLSTKKLAIHKQIPFIVGRDWIWSIRYFTRIENVTQIKFYKNYGQQSSSQKQQGQQRVSLRGVGNCPIHILKIQKISTATKWMPTRRSSIASFSCWWASPILSPPSFSSISVLSLLLSFLTLLSIFTSFLAEKFVKLQMHVAIFWRIIKNQFLDAQAFFLAENF